MPPRRRTRNTAAERVSDKFGGFAALAHLLGCHRNTPQHWSERGGYIPSRWHKPILALAKRKKIRIKPADLVHV